MSTASLELPNGEVLDLDERGYLLDFGAWTPLVAETMATADGLQLEDDHRAIFMIFREYFEAYGIEPPMRALVKRAKERLGDEKGNSRYLYRLFPEGPGTQACRYAGLPRPLSCV